MLRKEFAVGRPADVPPAPTHESLLRARRAKEKPPSDEEEGPEAR
ncbi:hypothetical protein GCM10017744_082290 [Streptomyces antimycoticus]